MDHIKISSFNCNGFKGSSDYVKQLIGSHDILFICEHWLQEYEISGIRDLFNDSGSWCYLKSSMDPLAEHRGRPYGGVGFLGNNRNGLIYDKIECDSDRICGIKVFRENKLVLTVFGLYLPYNDNSVNSMDIYLESLDKVQCLIDDCDSEAPVILIGDMNTSLPRTQFLTNNWFKKRPFCKRSAIFYNFVSSNVMCVANFLSEQSANYTFKKGKSVSYIDHMLVPAHIVPKIKDCKLLHNIPDNVSDHVALSMTLELETEILDGGTVNNSKLQSVPAFPKPQWQNKDYVNRYKFHLNAALVNVKCSPDDLLKINNDSAVLFVNNLHDSLCDAMHEAARQCSTEFPYKRVKVCKTWWTRDCTRARDRNRLFFHIWKSVGRPKQGVTYDCYRESRRAYRRTCKQAVENGYSKKFNLINKLYKENKTARMWNLVRKSKGNRTSENAINMNTLKEHFRVKFDAVPLNKTQCEALDTVNIKYDDMRNACDDLSVFSVYKVRKYIKQL